MNGRPHGYIRYTAGCRCDTCRTAKATYVRERRAAANALAAQVGPGPYQLDDDRITHGSRFAYEERGCRCTPCVTAKRNQWRAENRRARDRRTNVAQHAASL